MIRHDSFAELARFYDPLMREINYDRWFFITTLVGELAGRPPVRHLDLACGTARLIQRTASFGWESVGVDLSVPMLRQARTAATRPAVVAADLTDLPFAGQFDIATCLFDSLNFLLDETDLARAMDAASQALHDEGLFYFDIITERMVLRYFADQEWEEDNGRFGSHWTGRYDRKTRIAELDIRVNRRAPVLVRERVYEIEFVRRAAQEAGLTILACVDAETWEEPTDDTERVEFVASRDSSGTLKRSFDKIRARGREAVQTMLGSTHR